MKHRVGIIDYSSSNLISLSKCLETLEIEFIISKNSKRLSSCDVLILPGVGTFEKVMSFLKKTKLDNLIKEFSKNKSKKIIGICIGMQILSYKGNETTNKKFINGLGLINTKVEKIGNSHIGWNKIKTFKFLNKEFNNKYFFFNHSYVVKNLKSNLCYGTFSLGNIIYPSIVKDKNVYGFQFHPEKSHFIGSHFLKKIIYYEN